MQIRRIARGALAALVTVLAVLPSLARAHDVSVPGSKALIMVNTATGAAAVKSAQKGADVHFGAVAAPAELSASFEVFYVDAPANDGTIDMPSPWASTGATTVKFRNADAPDGPSVVKSATIAAGRVVKLSAKGIGALDVSSAPGAGGVVTLFTLHNAADASTHRFCSRYAVADGSVVLHRSAGTSARLLLKRGVPAPCPTCVDGLQNAGETGIDCGGGACPGCAAGAGCEQPGDCSSGVCTALVCE